jgi:hypothetical protein
VSTTRLILPYIRIEGSSAEAQFLIGGTLVQVGPTSTGGFFTPTFQIPPDADRSRPIDIIVYLCKATGIAPITAQDVVIRVDLSIVDPTFSIQEFQFTDIVTIPASWQNGSWIRHRVNGANPTIPPFTIPDQSLMGARVRRNGGDPLDTYAITLGLLSTTELTYNQLCGFCGCP